MASLAKLARGASGGEDTGKSGSSEIPAGAPAAAAENGACRAVMCASCVFVQAEESYIILHGGAAYLNASGNTMDRSAFWQKMLQVGGKRGGTTPVCYTRTGSTGGFVCGIGAISLCSIVAVVGAPILPGVVDLLFTVSFARAPVPSLMVVGVEKCTSFWCILHFYELLCGCVQWWRRI